MANNHHPAKHQPEVLQKSYELRILQSLRRIIKAIDIHSRKLASFHRITGPQLGCLLALQERPSKNFWE